MHTIESVGAFFQPLEEAIHQHFLPALTGRMPRERELLSLPCHSGGLNIPNPTCCSDFQFSSSKLLSASLVAMIQQQTEDFHIPYLQQAHSTIPQSRQQMLTSCLANIQSRVDPQLQETIELNNSSLWLTALPLQEQGFHLNKQEFRDALCLRYGWQLANIPSHCVRGTSFSVDHTMIFRHGGLTFIRHNELRDLTAQWLQEVCHDVTVEPPLLPLDGEIITPTSANSSDNARADIHTRGF